VEWKDTEFACPCHGSTFNPDGTVANGPATDPLSPYEAKIEGDLVLIKAR
jgi:cytochrome b6-f complex iron-sulfur subunit